MPDHEMKIRMGAPYWDATLSDGTHYDFAEMAKTKKWPRYKAFEADYRRIVGGAA